jgi:hypothetical protein
VDFGLVLMGYHGCWDDVAFAEQHGFATAGFVDSPLLAGDPFVCMALAAQATTRMRVGTMLAIPDLRRAPVPPHLTREVVTDIEQRIMPLLAGATAQSG